MSSLTRLAREQVARERAERAAREARIKRAAADNPDLTVNVLAERFGCSPDSIVRLLPPGDPWRRYSEDPLRWHNPRRHVLERINEDLAEQLRA